MLLRAYCRCAMPRQSGWGTRNAAGNSLRRRRLTSERGVRGGAMNRRDILKSAMNIPVLSGVLSGAFSLAMPFAAAKSAFDAAKSVDVPRLAQ